MAVFLCAVAVLVFALQLVALRTSAPHHRDSLHRGPESGARLLRPEASAHATAETPASRAADALQRALDELGRKRISIEEPPTHSSDPRRPYVHFERIPARLLYPPHTGCDTAAAISAVPAFTRRDERVRPRFAVITLVAKRVGVADDPQQRRAMNRFQFVNKLQYCQRHGYDFIMEGDAALDRRRAPHWSKIRVLRKWLPLYEWVMWMDEDTLFTNWNQTIEQVITARLQLYLLRDYRQQRHAHQQLLERVAAQEARVGVLRAPSGAAQAPPMFDFKPRTIDVIVVEDWNGVNTGVMLIRNSPWSGELLQRMYRVSPKLAAPWNDQGALNHLIYPQRRDDTEAADTRAHLAIFQDNFMNAYPQDLIESLLHLRWEWERGDWVAHFASCSFTSNCLDAVQWFFVDAACAFGGSTTLPPPAPGAATRGNTSTAPAAPSLFEPPDVYYPPADEDSNRRATLPPLNEPVPDLDDALVFSFTTRPQRRYRRYL